MPPAPQTQLPATFLELDYIYPSGQLMAKRLLYILQPRVSCSQGDKRARLKRWLPLHALPGKGTGAVLEAPWA